MLTSDSSKIVDLIEFLKTRGIDFVTEVRGNRPPPFHYAVFIPSERVSALAKPGFVSKRQLKNLQSALREHLGIAVEWIEESGSRSSAMEAALLQLLEMKFPGRFREVFISGLKSRPICVWIEPLKDVDDYPSPEEIRAVVQTFMDLYGLAEFVVDDGTDTSLPSNSAILRRLKIHAPVVTSDLAGQLAASGATVPDDRWLQRKLDRLRKQGLVHRESNGAYCLTELALKAVPHGRGRTSSDVERALALGRRKW